MIGDVIREARSEVGKGNLSKCKVQGKLFFKKTARTVGARRAQAQQPAGASRLNIKHTTL